MGMARERWYHSALRTPSSLARLDTASRIINLQGEQ
jgi:hypothetical protein